MTYLLILFILLLISCNPDQAKEEMNEAFYGWGLEDGERHYSLHRYETLNNVIRNNVSCKLLI